MADCTPPVSALSGWGSTAAAATDTRSALPSSAPSPPLLSGDTGWLSTVSGAGLGSMKMVADDEEERGRGSTLKGSREGVWGAVGAAVEEEAEEEDSGCVDLSSSVCDEDDGCEADVLLLDKSELVGAAPLSGCCAVVS